jgi:hypothetical protein
VGFAYALAAELEAEWPRIHGYGPLAPHTFGETLWRDVLAIFAVCVDAAPVGVASLYDVDYRHGIGWVEVVLARGAETDPTVRRDAAVQITDLGFARFGLRKLFCRHTGCQAPPLGPLAVEEARLTDAVLHEGWYWDDVITAVTAPISTSAEVG